MNGKGYYKYAEDVVSGRVVAGKFVKQACQRFLDFMDNSDYEFREESVDRVISLFYHLRHSNGRHSGSRFTLEPWQQWIIASIYGFYRVSDGSRLTNTV